MKLNGKSISCLAISFLFFYSSVLTAHAAESNLWEERRQATRQLKERPSLAESLPAVGITENQLASAGLTQEQYQLFAQLPRAASFDMGVHENVSISGEAARQPVTSGLSLPAAPPVSKPDSKRPPRSEWKDSPTWLSTLILPYGAIRDLHLASRPDAPFIIHLQDAHEIAEAQKNIAAMIQGLREERGISLVGLEGAQGGFALEPYRAYADRDVTKGIADYFLREGYIGGPEFAGITAENPPLLWGVEDLADYESNIQAFKDSVKFKPVAHAFLREAARETERLKSLSYSAELQEFDRNFSAYKSRQGTLGDYVRYLLDTYPQSRRGYTNLFLLMSALDWEAALDFKEVEKERMALVELFAKKLTNEQLSLLVQQSLQYRLGHMGYGDYYRFLRRLCLENGIDLEGYGQLKSYINYVLLAEQINRNDLLMELGDLEQKTQDSLARRPDQERLVAAHRNLLILQKLTSHSMTPADWIYYEKNKERILRFAPELAEVAKSLGTEALLPEPPSFAEIIRPFEEFCRYALQRNHSLVENLLAKMQTEKATRAVLVAGGFHSDGLTQLLRSRDVSYVVVTPKISEVPDDSHYLDIFAHDPTPLEKMFSGETIYLKAPLMTAAKINREISGLRRFMTEGQFVQFQSLFDKRVGDAVRAGDERKLDAALTELKAMAKSYGSVRSYDVSVESGHRQAEQVGAYISRLNRIKGEHATVEFRTVAVRAERFKNREDALAFLRQKGFKTPVLQDYVEFQDGRYLVFQFPAQSVLADIRGWVRELQRALGRLPSDDMEFSSELVGTDFREELGRRLGGQESSILGLETFSPRNLADLEPGRYVSVDWGGTNLRAHLVEIGREEGRIAHKMLGSREFKWSERVDIGKDGKALFAAAADLIDDLLEGDKSEEYTIGLVFSFPAELENRRSARITGDTPTKGFNAFRELEGEDVVSLFEEALSARGFEAVKVGMVANDTVAVQAAASLKSGEPVDVGMILATGFNISATLGSHVLNLEAGGYRLPEEVRTAQDRRLDEQSENPGRQLFEKGISGKYLGELVRLTMAERYPDWTVSSPAFGARDGFDSKYLSLILGGNFEFLKDDFGIDATPAQRRGLDRLTRRVVARSAKLTAAAVAAILREQGATGRVRIGVDGSLYEKTPGYRERLEENIEELLPEADVEFVFASDANAGATALGAVALAAAAKKEDASRVPPVVRAAREGGVDAAAEALNELAGAAQDADSTPAERGAAREWLKNLAATLSDAAEMPGASKTDVEKAVVVLKGMASLEKIPALDRESAARRIVRLGETLYAAARRSGAEDADVEAAVHVLKNILGLELADQSERDRAMEGMIALAESDRYEAVYRELQYRFESLTDAERDDILARYREVIGEEGVDEFLLLAEEMKRRGESLVYINGTFYGGGVAEMFQSAVPLLVALGVDVQWHILWAANPAVFGTTKIIHNSIQGFDQPKPDWDLYDATNDRLSRLFANLYRTRKNFIVDDPQPAPQNKAIKDVNPAARVIARLHIDTSGTADGGSGVDIWNRLAGIGWNHADVFLHQPGHAGLDGVNPVKAASLDMAPAINLLAPKNFPKSAAEARANIETSQIRDDEGRTPLLDAKGKKWMTVSRADPAKGLQAGLLGFVNQLTQDPDSVLWFFVAFASDDPEGYGQYLMYKLLIEDEAAKREVLERTLREKVLKEMPAGEADRTMKVLTETRERLAREAPSGVRLKDRVQIFTNLSDEIADFATLADGHMVLSTKEGYNMVMLEIARHIVPVVATDLPVFGDRVVDGEMGGWSVELSPRLARMDPIDLLEAYTAGDAEVSAYVSRISGRLRTIAENPELARRVATELDEWIKKNGNLLANQGNRMAVILADEREWGQASSANDLRRLVVSRLRGGGEGGTRVKLAGVLAVDGKREIELTGVNTVADVLARLNLRPGLAVNVYVDRQPVTNMNLPVAGREIAILPVIRGGSGEVMPFFEDFTPETVTLAEFEAAYEDGETSLLARALQGRTITDRDGRTYTIRVDWDGNPNAMDTDMHRRFVIVLQDEAEGDLPDSADPLDRPIHLVVNPWEGKLKIQMDARLKEEFRDKGILSSILRTIADETPTETYLDTLILNPQTFQALVQADVAAWKGDADFRNFLANTLLGSVAGNSRFTRLTVRYGAQGPEGIEAVRRLQEEFQESGLRARDRIKRENPHFSEEEVWRELAALMSYSIYLLAEKARPSDAVPPVYGLGDAYEAMERGDFETARRFAADVIRTAQAEGESRDYIDAVLDLMNEIDRRIADPSRHEAPGFGAYAGRAFRETVLTWAFGEFFLKMHGWAGRIAWRSVRRLVPADVRAQADRLAVSGGIAPGAEAFGAAVEEFVEALAPHRGLYRLARLVFRVAGVSAARPDKWGRFRIPLRNAVRTVNQRLGETIRISDVSVLRAPAEAPGEIDRNLMAFFDTRAGRLKIMVSPAVLEDFQRKAAADPSVSFETRLVRALLHEILESRGFSHERVEALGFREGGLGDLDGLFRAFAAAGEVDGQETVGMPEGIGAKIAYLGRLVLGGRVKPVDFEQLELTPERIAELALRRRDQAAEARNEIAGFYRRSSDVAAALESFLREGDADYASFRRAAGPVSKEALRQSLTAEILSDDAPVLRRYLALAVLQALGGKITDQRRLAEALGFSAGSRAADFLALAALTGGKEVAAGLKAYQDFMRKASGVERADAAVTRLNRELAQAGKPAFARMVEWSAAATIHRSAELSGTELTAARLARSEILRADQDHKVAIPVLAAEGQAVTENAVFESLVNRLDLDRSELDRKIDEGVVRIFVVSGREFSDGHVQEWLGSLGVETLQVFALNEGHWNLSDRLKAIVNLLLMLEGGVVKDATRRISDEIEYIGLLNIQA